MGDSEDKSPDSHHDDSESDPLRFVVFTEVRDEHYRHRARYVVSVNYKGAFGGR